MSSSTIVARKALTHVLQWRHNEHNGVLNHRYIECLLKGMFRRRSKKTSKPRVTGLCEGNSLVTGEFPAQRASNATNVSIWWRHHCVTLQDLATVSVNPWLEQNSSYSSPTSYNDSHFVYQMASRHQTSAATSEVSCIIPLIMMSSSRADNSGMATTRREKKTYTISRGLWYLHCVSDGDVILVTGSAIYPIRGPLYWHGLTKIMASNHTHCFIWGVITHP